MAAAMNPKFWYWRDLEASEVSERRLGVLRLGVCCW